MWSAATSLGATADIIEMAKITGGAHAPRASFIALAISFSRPYVVRLPSQEFSDRLPDLRAAVHYGRLTGFVVARFPVPPTQEERWRDNWRWRPGNSTESATATKWSSPGRASPATQARRLAIPLFVPLRISRSS